MGPERLLDKNVVTALNVIYSPYRSAPLISNCTVTLSSAGISIQGCFSNSNFNLDFKQPSRVLKHPADTRKPVETGYFDLFLSVFQRTLISRR